MGGGPPPIRRGYGGIVPRLWGIRYIINRGELRPVTDLDDAREPVSRSPAGLLTRPLRPYAEIFEIPGAWRFSVAGIIGRMPMSMFGLGTVLLISAITGKYGVAGTVSAVGSLGYAFSSPRLGRLVDSHGQRIVLLPLLAVFTVSTALLITAVELRLPTWAFFVPGAIAGTTIMPFFMPAAESLDINDPSDWARAEQLAAHPGALPTVPQPAFSGAIS